MLTRKISWLFLKKENSRSSWDFQEHPVMLETQTPVPHALTIIFWVAFLVNVDKQNIVRIGKRLLISTFEFRGKQRLIL